MMSVIQNETFIPSYNDVAIAKRSEEMIRTLRDLSDEVDTVRIGDIDDAVELPAVAVRFLADILEQIAKDQIFMLVPIDSELTTQQAANLLNVSQSYLIDLLEEDKIPYRSVDDKYRLQSRDVITYKKDMYEKRLGVLAELAQQAQELNMGY